MNVNIMFFGRITMAVLTKLPLYLIKSTVACLPFYLLSINHNAYAEDSVIEEVIVTAQKREQSLQDIGYSISVIDGDQIQKLGMTKSEDIALQVPNLGIRNVLGNSFPIISIRGVSLVDTKANNVSSAAVHIDEIYYSSPILIGLQLFDLERTEILKGPQGTLFGRNTTAGTINFVSRRPGDDTDGFANFTLGSFKQRRVEAGLNIPASDNVKIRLSGVYEQSDGYTKNRLTDRNLGGDKRLSLRVLTDWRINDSTNILINLHGGNDKSEVGGFQHRALIPEGDEQCSSLTSPNPTDTSGCVDLLGYVDSDNDPFAGDFNIEAEYDSKQFGGSITLNKDIGSTTLTSITALDRYSRNHEEDNDASPNRLVDQNNVEEFNTFSQELRLASIDNNKALNWIVGFYYATEDIDLFRDADLTDLIGAVLSANAKEERSAFAVYAHAEWLLSEKIRLTTGLRYTDESKAYDYSNNSGFADMDFSSSVDFNNISGRVGLDYFATDDMLLYVSISKGFKSGGWPSGITEDPTTLIPYNEEKVIAYEVGFKSTALSSRLRFNASFFYYDYSDLQQFTFISQGAMPPLQVFGNASDSTAKGLEIETQWVPTDGLEFQFGLGLLDTKFSGFNTLGDATDLSGQSLPNAPSTNINGLARYQIFLNNGSRVYFQSSATYESDFSFGIERASFTSQDNYWLINARVGINSKDDLWGFSIWGKNITNERYLVSAIDTTLGYALQAFGKPASLGVTINFNW